jgi:tetratricopeptide (TPR) repeat protein
MLLHVLEQYEAASICYRRASALAPDSSRWLYYLGVVETSLGHYDQALAALRDSLKLAPGDLPARLSLAAGLLVTGDLPESLRAYEEVLRDTPTCARAHYGLGKVLESRGNWTAAADSYRKACDAYRDYGAAHYALAMAYRRLGDDSLSKEHLASFEKHQDDAPPREDPLLDELDAIGTSAQSLVRQARGLTASGRLEEAAALYERALRIDPSLVAAHLGLIPIYGSLGRDQDADRHYREGLALDPHLEAAHYHHGLLLARRRQYAEAEASFRKALEINPFYAESARALGGLLLDQGRMEEALAQFRKAVESRPDDPESRFELGRLLLMRRSYEEAIEHLSRLLDREDARAPTYAYTLAMAYTSAGRRAEGLEVGHKAEVMAAALGQTELKKSIEASLAMWQRPGESR